MAKKAIIVGSAPISADLAEADLSDYQKIAVNKSWGLRNDFDVHVFLKSLGPKFRPRSRPGLSSIGVEKFSPILNTAGGIFLTSGSVTMIAGYWATTHSRAKIVSYYGCDLVFDGGPGGNTHYYGSGDEGPLKGNFQYNLRQEERSIRLFIWALMHRTLMTNSSGLPGSKLCFPKLDLNTEDPIVLDALFSTPEYAALLRAGGNALAFEAENRTPMFRRKQKLFEDHQPSLDAMDQMLDQWHACWSLVDDFNDRVLEMTTNND